jgi:serine/threonine protein kinase
MSNKIKQNFYKKFLNKMNFLKTLKNFMEGNLNDYTLIKCNYKTSNKVFKGKKKDGKDVIIKIMDYPPYKELDILIKLKPICEYFLCIESFGKIKTENNSYFISTEFIKGVTLTEYLKKDHSKNELIKVMNEIIKSIKKLHNLGIVHNDINSENIIITPDNKIRIIDFGEANENKKYMYNDFLQLQRIFSKYL